jgi:nitroreductase
MELTQAIINRRSVRSFGNEPISKETINKIIEFANHAPSACDRQDWKFIVIDDQGKKDKLADLGGSILIKSAPLGILVLYGNQTINTEYRDDIQSASAAIQNILLMCAEMQLAACWICHLPPAGQVRRLFKVPGHYSPVAYILIGKGKTAPAPMPRKHQPEDMVCYNSFSQNWQKKHSSSLAFFLKSTAAKLYFRLPIKIKILLNPLVDKNFVNKFKN